MTARSEGRQIPLAIPVAYPIAIAVAYVGILFLGIGGSIFSAPRVFLAAGIGAAMFGVICNLLMRDRDRGGLLSLAIVLLVIFGTSWPVVIALGGAMVLMIVERLVSQRRPSRVPWTRISLIANGVAVILLLTLVITGIQDGGFGRILRELSPVRPQVPAAATTEDRPDIYILLLDGYARPDKMKALFQFDDGPFISDLEERGFDVSARSRSNYLLTTLSIPSMLNMRHIDDMFVATPNAGDAAYRTVIRSFVNDGEVIRRMRGLGYQITAVSGGFEEVVMYEADRLIDTGQVNEYEFLMMRVTAVAPLLNLLAPDFLADQHRARTIAVLDAAAAVARSPRARPRFTFVHVPSPHGPIVFGPHGESIPAPGPDRFFEDTAHGLRLSREAFGRRYVGQVQYLNGRVIQTIDAILAASPEPPVILVLSDHGSGSGLVWSDMAQSDLDERSAILLAAHTPGHSNLFPDDITLVNVFGRLFGGYFGIYIPDQPDLVFRWDDSNTHLIVAPEMQVAD